MKKYIGQHIFDYVASFRQNVGIGTDTPSEKLEVNGNIKIQNNNSLISKNVAGAARTLISLANDNILRIKGNDSEGSSNVISMINGGNVGIGLTNPTEKLHVSGNAIITGNLTVSGTTTTINTTNLNVEDKNITINYSTGDSSSTADGAGITIQDAVDSSTDATILWDATTDRFDFSNDIQLPDSKQLILGDSADLKIKHNGTNSVIANDAGGHLVIQQNVDDKDIRFQCDDGSGGTTTYLTLAGNSSRTLFSKEARFSDNVNLKFGDGGDLQIYHDGTTSKITNDVGDIHIQNNTDDGDIILRSDDGSGGTTAYITIDGSETRTVIAKAMRFNDSTSLQLGGDADISMHHDGSNGFFNNNTGDLTFTQNTDDGDILFKCDDGSGGTTDYVRIDGNNQFIRFDKNTYHPTGKRITIGSGQEGRIFYESSTLKITQTEDDADISFQCDDGSGGVTEYFRLDGSSETVEVAKATNFASTVTASSYKISAATVLSGSTNVTLGSAGATGTISLTTHGGTPFRIDDNDRIIITRDGGHTSGNISASQSTVDIFNPHTNDTDEKGSILTFSDNYFDSGGAQKTIRAAIKGGTDTTGNTGDGFLAFYTDSSTANSATERARINKDGNFSVHSTQQSYATGTSFTGAVDGLTGSINTLGGISVKRQGFFGGFVMFKGMTQTSRGIEVRPSTTGNGTAFFPVMIGRNNDTGNANYLLVGGPGGNEWAFGLFDSNQSGGTPVDQSHMIRFKAGTASDSQPRIFVGDSGSNTTNSYIEVAGHKVGTTKAVVLLHGSDGVVGNSGSNSSDSHTWTITHGMGSSRNYKVEIIQNSGNYDTVHADITRPSDTTIVVTFSAAVANSAYKALILKCG